MIEIRPATLRDATWVAAHMRDQDWREIAAVALTDSKTGAGAWLVSHSEHAYVAYLRDEPVAVFGVAQVGRPHFWSGWAFGTDRMKRAVPAITRFCLEHIKPDLIARGVLRVEVKTLIDHDLSHGWLAKMGAAREGIARSYGAGGEDYAVYAWSRPLRPFAS